jgi:hypothetical protein
MERSQFHLAHSAAEMLAEHELRHLFNIIKLSDFIVLKSKKFPVFKWFQNNSRCTFIHDD